MKKHFKILWITLGAVLLVLIGLWLLRNVILTYAFEELVSTETKGKVHLEINSLDVSILHQTIRVDSLAIKFDSIYLDKEQHSELKRINFSGVLLKNFNLFNLLVNKKLIADKLLFFKPDVFISEDGTEKKKVKDPKELLKLIEHSSLNNFGVLAHIRSVELRYGQVEIVDIHDPEIRFTTKSLTIFLDDFNSIDKKDWFKGEMFFSKSLYLKVSGFYKSFNPGYALAIDSLSWFTGDYDMDAYGIRLVAMDRFPDSLPRLNIQAKSILMNNFHLKGEDSINKATVRKLILNDGMVQLREAKTDRRDKKKQVNGKALFQLILADTLILNRNQLFLETHAGDTILSFNNLDLRLEHIKLDSSFMDNPEEHLSYSSFRFVTESFVSERMMPGTHIQSGTVSYNSKWDKFVLDGFQIKDDKGAFDFHSGRIKLNISLKALLKNQHQKVDAFVIRPFLALNLKKLAAREKSQKNKESNINLESGNIKLVHATVKAVLNNGIDKVELQDANLDLNNLKYNKAEHLLNWNKLLLNTTSLAFEKQGYMSVNSGALSFNGRNLTLYNLEISGKQGALHSFSLKKLNITALDIVNLVFNKTFNADNLMLSSPVLSLIITPKDKSSSDSVFSFARLAGGIEKESDYKININRLAVKNGTADVEINKSDTVSGFHTLFDLTWNKVRFGHSNDAPLSNLKGFELNLQDAYHFGNGLRTTVDNFALRSDDGYLGISNVKVIHHDSSLVGRWNIRDLSLKFIGVRNFDFQHLLGNDKILFGKLLVDGLIVDVSKYGTNSSKNIDESEIKPVSFNLQKELPFETMFDTIEVKNLSLNYIQSDSSSTTRYGVGDFRFTFSPGLKKNNKHLSSALLLNESAMQFDSLIVRNDRANMHLMVNQGVLNPEMNSLSLTGIEMSVDDNKEAQQQTQLNIDTIALNEISVFDSLPLTLNLKLFKVSNLDLNISNKKNKVKKLPADSALKMAGLYRFSKILNKVTIDTILFNDIDLDYFNTDSSKKHLTVDDVKLMVNNVEVNPSVALDTLPVKFGNLFAELHDRSFITNDSLYELKAQRLSYDYLNKTLNIDSFYVTPLLDTAAFFKRHKWQTQRVNLFVPTFAVSGFDFNTWNRTGIMTIGKITTDGLHARLYRDKNYPRDSLYRPLLQGMLRKVKMPFSIDSVKLTNAYIYYGELGIKSIKPGFIYLNDFNLTAVNITNRQFNNEKSLAKLFVDFSLMGKGKVEGNFYFPLSEKQGSQFWFSLKTEKLDLTTFNTMTQNLAGITILKGKGSIDIPLVTANDTVSLGSMLFRYRNLKLSLYNRKRAKRTGGISSPMINFILNDLVLRSNNPVWFRRPRVGIVYFKRDRNKSIVNFVWKSTLSGILSTLGFNNKEQRKRRKEYRKQEFDVQREAVKNEKYGQE